jgi:hypothetical protein
MKPIYSRMIKTIVFAPSWIAIILAGLGYLFLGTWGGTIWGEILMLLMAVVIAFVIYRVVVYVERGKYK